MTTSPNLNLPFVAAGQAQKHVTVNEGLVLIDSLMHLAVQGAPANAPPAEPAQGSRWLVGDAPDGAWTGHAGRLAVFLDGGWRFHAPMAGWLVHRGDSRELLAFDGAAWSSLAQPESLQGLELLGVGMEADAARPLSVAGDGVLLTHAGDDHRLAINKAGAADTASVILQSNWSGRAELGLAGGDDFSLKVSADGATWTEALSVDRQSGAVSFPMGAALERGYRNLVMNGAFSVNQRAFAGGTLAAGVYGPDRWKAGPGGALFGVTGGVATLTGALRQVIEDPGLAGMAVIVSLEAPTADIAVTVGDGAGLTASGVIPAGSGRRGVALTVPSGVTGHLTLDLVAAASTAFSRVQLEVGRVATAFERRPLALELELCRRYFEQIGPGPGTHNPVAVAGGLTSTIVSGIVPFAEKRATPSVSIAGAYDIVGVATAASVTSLSAFTVTRKAFEMRAVLSAPVTLPACGIFRTANDAAARITISAEL